MLMLRPYTLILLGLSLTPPSYAGLFADEGARKRIEQVEERTTSLDSAVKKQTKLMIDLQGEIDALNGEIRKLRGQNEELMHGLQDAEKRQKDFYLDLDTRLRHFEAAEAAAKEAAAVTPSSSVSSDPNDPAPANREFENAYATYKRGNHAEAAKAFRVFLKNHPHSAHAADANFWLGSAQLSLKEYKGALGTYQGLLKDFPDTHRAADTYLNIAECRRALKFKGEPQKSLKQLIATYPDSEAAAKAKKLLADKK